MRLLLDSHAFLWFGFDSARLSPKANRAIVDAAKVYVSHASLWEMTIKQSLGRLRLEAGLEDMAARSGMELLGITLDHIRRVGQLPRHHGDPFDRMLVAQAIVEGLELVSADALIHRYPVAWLW